MSKNIQSIPLNSELIKALILSKARFAHQLKFMATEVGAFNADVLYIDKKDQLIEVEVKISKSDLINDFKKRKHLYFDSPNQQEFTPHYFYFCTPEFLIDDAQEILKDTKYGLLKCLNWYGNIRASSDKIIIIKKA